METFMKHVLAIALVVAASVAADSMNGELMATAAESCAGLASLKLPSTTIVLAQRVAAGGFTPPSPYAAGPRGALTLVTPGELPEFCRVAGIARPSNDSVIKFEVWMPAANWNGKFLGIGNGGFAGSINYAGMSAGLARQYATASTDTGHQGNGTDPSFALGHPEKLLDFSYRAVHEMTVHAKSIIAAYYARAPRFSYWNGCSLGGRQGLAEAQRFPADFNGIVVGAPANWLTHFQAEGLWNRLAIERNPDALVSPSKLAVLHTAVLAACDARDGVTDGILEDPTRCDFDPKTIECTGEDRPDCLTRPQVELVRQFYDSLINPRTKKLIYPGYARGGEPVWGDAAKTGHMVPRSRFGDPGGVFKYLLFQDPSWDYRTFDFDAELARADQLDGGLTSNMDPNLRPFFARGGKLLQYHGWSDPSPSPLNSVNYYKSVVNLLGGAATVHDSYRLFMVPGMYHCEDGDGPNTFDSIRAIEQWVEARQAPDRIITSHRTDAKVDRTRPLCPYPQVASYKGRGSTDEAANFACRMP